MRVLFIGGTGVISRACTELASRRGKNLTLVNRGKADVPVPPGVKTIVANVRDRRQFRDALAGENFDVVVNWIAYLPEHVEADLEAFAGRVGQYIFISSASAYQKPVVNLLERGNTANGLSAAGSPTVNRITESTPLGNPFWQYARDKVACEVRLMEAWRRDGFPVTIVRPSHTYGDMLIPNAIGAKGYSLVARMKAGRPVIVHDDGQSLWTLTHNSDFAKGFVGLLGNLQTLGESYHITSDESLTWDQIYQEIGRAAGVEPKLVHVPSDVIARFDERVGASLLGDKAWSMVFDNSKIRRIVPDFVDTGAFSNGPSRPKEAQGIEAQVTNSNGPSRPKEAQGIEAQVTNSNGPSRPKGAQGIEAQVTKMPSGCFGRETPFEKAATVPFAEGIKRTLAWFHADPIRMTPHAESDELQDRILAAWRKP